MEKLTYLSKSKDFLYRLKYLQNKYSFWKSLQILWKTRKFKTEDCFVIICKFNKEYLIAKLKKDYEFCPGDWGFIDTIQRKHIKGKEPRKKVAFSLPFYYAGLNSKRIIKETKPFHWLDKDSKFWWHIFSYLIKVNSKKYIINKKEKFSQFKWVKKEDFSKYSRKNYLEDISKEVLR